MYELIVLLFIIILIAAWVYRDAIRDYIVDIIRLWRHDRQLKYGGSHRQPYFYHGSDRIIDVFEPRPANVIDGERAVFATSSYDDAVVFSATWTDYDFGFGSTNGKKHLVENYPGALEKLNKDGYIHSLDSKYFERDKRLGLSNEYISRSAVAAAKYEVVNIAEYLENSPIKIIKFTENLGNDDVIESALQHRIATLYILIDPYWKVPESFIQQIEEQGLKTIFFHHYDTNEVVKTIRKGGSDVKYALIGDPVDREAGVIKFGFVSLRFILEPKVLVGPKSAKTSAAEYARFIDARRKLFNGVPVIQV